MTVKWTAAQLPDLTGKTFVVTGATGGIGLVAAREVARAGAHVVMAVRDPDKGAKVAGTFGRTRGQVDVQRLDVASLESVRAFADSWAGSVDVLINNAGIMMVPYASTHEGLESQMATNYFGPFALTNAMLPHVTDRVVSIGSQLHRMGTMRPDDLNWQKREYNPWNAYCDSKLDVQLFSYELQRRLEAVNSPVRSVIAHPGIAKTNLVSHVGGVAGWLNGLARPLLNDAEHGALPTLYAATQEVDGNAYVGPDGFASIKGYPKVRKPSRAARSPESAATLWSATVQIVGAEFSFALGR
jgi:NAD(P)-dependent dehydrogenase (short-subunit alcohol dehydrogenase family)